MAITLPTSGGHSVDIVRSRTKATEFSLVLVLGNCSARNTTTSNTNETNYKIKLSFATTSKTWLYFVFLASLDVSAFTRGHLQVITPTLNKHNGRRIAGRDKSHFQLWFPQTRDLAFALETLETQDGWNNDVEVLFLGISSTL
jgi:hypothetical protein